MTYRIFISSVQHEFANERKSIADMICKDLLLSTFFEVFLFERTTAQDRSAQGVYLTEVRNSDIYLGIFGDEYGSENADGVSPTECEYNCATELGKYRMAFVKRAASKRSPKERAFVAKIERDVTRKSFSSPASLRKVVYESLFVFLKDRNAVNVRPFDESFSLGVRTSDLDENRIADFIRMVRTSGKVPFPAGIPASEILSRLGAAGEADDKISNAAALLFAKDPAKFDPSWEIKCVQLWGTEFEKPFPSYHIYRGTVFEQIDQALDFVMSRVDHRVEARDAPDSTQAPARSEFPVEAIREAIVNAVCHRDYTDDGSVQVMLFRDRLEVLNPGTLPRGWTAANLLRAHDSKPHYGILATAMQWAGYVEKSGYGTEDIVRKCKAWGLREPEYHPSSVDFRIVLWRNATAALPEFHAKGKEGEVIGEDKSEFGNVTSSDSNGYVAMNRLHPPALNKVKSQGEVAGSLQEKSCYSLTRHPGQSTLPPLPVAEATSHVYS